jgi:hypothetical protein
MPRWSKSQSDSYPARHRGRDDPFYRFHYRKPDDRHDAGDRLALPLFAFHQLTRQDILAALDRALRDEKNGLWPFAYPSASGRDGAYRPRCRRRRQKRLIALELAVLYHGAGVGRLY